ncbi:hypothetical protein [Vibrio parahaemolyticus]|uniref:hypothetical protein n=1 Tax=Vibrio parahaemolyticus TaxID=670 RepID=UPI001B81BA4B|nr:hypothetical protein [Vibrio parahaemolyticus]EHZ2645678.1 hypothetical protein [Vibrio parahaemolyticus]EJG0102064.1 hypothetical protein [Vibrio parahaemolyticus]EJG0561290.1 hypothetical protein [Vibrio parahaemolyticus]EJG0571610.1 hypothetical protein [Vibrio parahaemolyticus]ELM4063112.1 hypothetical protein [Vibrio parahaemolyticus]
MDKPQDIDSFCSWYAEKFELEIRDQKSKIQYQTNIKNAYNSVQEHPFFCKLPYAIQDWSSEYSDNFKSELFMDSGDPTLVTKPYDSSIDKLFRVNVLWNKNFPEKPPRNWVNFQNLFVKFNDLIRGTMVCRFIDGPEFVSNKLIELANEVGLTGRKYTQERDDGYYAYHVYIKFPVSLLDEDWNEKEAQIEVEIQVTTQLQEVLRAITHKFYEEKRINPKPEQSNWKWDFKSKKFKVGYLSHTLHLLESIILESRDDVLKKEVENND